MKKKSKSVNTSKKLDIESSTKTPLFYTKNKTITDKKTTTTKESLTLLNENDESLHPVYGGSHEVFFLVFPS